MLARLILVLLLAASAAAQELLPPRFAGWEKSADARSSTDPKLADSAFAPVLQEFGFLAFEEATYTKPGRKLSLRAARFHDASGAYGAFAFYKQPDMASENIGDQAGSANLHVMFYRGNLLVNAVLDKLTAMSAAELRELASLLPAPAGEARRLPILPTYLPKQGYIRNSARYVLGPATLAAVNAPISADLVDFSRGAELVLGRYGTTAGQAWMVLISYPTPQIAAQQLDTITVALQPPAESDATFEIKRTGPIIALVEGDIASASAEMLLADVNYDADITWNENTYVSPKDNVGSFLVAAFSLVGLVLLFALVMGFAFGGVRMVVKRLYPNRVFDRPEQLELIRLNISGREVQTFEKTGT